MDRLGIADDFRQSRERIAERLSPAARHQAFPGIYARPVPREQVIAVDRSPELLKQIEELKATNEGLRRENKRLSALVVDAGGVNARREATSIESVMEAFCEEMNAAGLAVGEEPWSLILLKTARRSRPISHPRHVCMWLVRKICFVPSLPAIGRAFGGKDHTSVMHGVRRAPVWMGESPELLAVAMAVLRSFGLTPVELEKGGRS